MARLVKIGVVGCGAIGSSLAKAITRDFSKRAKLSALYDIDAEKAKSLSRKVSGNAKLAVFGLKDLISKSELVIEAASATYSRQIARTAITKGRDIMIMSVGGIVESFDALQRLAARYNARVYIPSGAISGIDALKAAQLGKIKSVTLTTRKNPRSFRGVKYVQQKGIALDRIKGERLLFSGSAQQAVKYFPQNINVAAILSIAGLGPLKTRIKIIASALVKKNIHEIKIESKAASITTRTENVLHPDNPKTSYLAVLSAIAALRQILGPVKIGT